MAIAFVISALSSLYVLWDPTKSPQMIYTTAIPYLVRAGLVFREYGIDQLGPTMTYVLVFLSIGLSWPWTGDGLPEKGEIRHGPTD